MTTSSQKSNNCYHVRCISFPVRSHPCAVRAEEVLAKLKSNSEASSLYGFGELYRCIDELLHLPLTQQALSQHRREKWVNELLDGSVRYIDICNNTRDAVMLMKVGARELQSALRRSMVGESNIENSIAAYISSRKALKKEAAKSLAALKHIDIKCSEATLSEADHHLSSVFRVLIEANMVAVATFHLILLSLSVPVLKPRPTRWSLVSKLVHKGVVSSEVQTKDLNELKDVDNALTNFLIVGQCKDPAAKRIQTAQEKLAALDASIEDLENGLELLSRQLIHMRVSLLNAFSQ